MLMYVEAGAIHLSGLVCVSGDAQRMGQMDWLQFIWKMDCNTVH